ncbi:MAG TPA: ATP-binding protein [Candidatus Krumholzibacteriaceae bacterium]|nr:ATP-binding protein [Candidatus Krumholzibacteriaceae bacterium]
MQGKYIPRQLQSDLGRYMKEFPAVVILGPRQVGKSTLAKHFLRTDPGAYYLDLERPSDLRKLSDPELFFKSNPEKVFCLDEIQRTPELFPFLRSIIDENDTTGQFLILGSASRDLIRQSSETLAGRIAYLELTPFLCWEVTANASYNSLQPLWLRGGFPLSFLRQTEDASLRWREEFIRTFLERDIPQLGFKIPSTTMERLWQMLAHYHGHILNTSKLGQSLGMSHTTVKRYLDILTKSFMIRVLPPFISNVKKRLVKSPKVYIRDSGILNSLLEICDFNQLLGHPVFGASWEGIVIENILSNIKNCSFGFYRTSAGAEIDLVVSRQNRTIGIECKASTSPQVTRGFWNAKKDLKLDECLIVSPVDEGYPIAGGVSVCTLRGAVEKVQNRFL